MDYPTDLKYSTKHEWLKLDGNKAKLGISDYAQSELGDIVYVEFLPQAGDECAAGDELVIIDSAKTTAQVYTPVDCKVISLNEQLNEKPELMNTDPYGDGYLVEVELTNPSQADGLMDATAYTDFVASGGE
jgi:glycine cleavage system H protein